MPSDWRDESPATPDAIAALAAEARAAFPNLELDQDIAWLDTGRNPAKERLSVLALRENGRLIGYAPFFVHSKDLKFHLGEVQIGKRRVEGYHLECGPLVDAATPEAAADCLVALADQLPSRALVFLRGVPEPSPLHGYLHDKRGALRSKYHLVPHGPRYQRCRIAWTGSFEQYLNTLGKVSRKDLRRTLKRPEKQYGADFDLKRYSAPDAMDAFLELARGISRKTYQEKLLGMDLSADARLPVRLKTAAARSQFLGHILFMKEQPVAFHYGIIHRRSFYMAAGGYDPAWAEGQVGMLTFLKVLQDIEQHKDPITTLDYLHGEATYKIRTSNQHTPERHYYLVKKNVSGAILAATMSATDGFSRAAGDLLARYGIKQKLKRLIRRHAVMSPSTDEPDARD